jgi:hypothetical protein
VLIGFIAFPASYSPLALSHLLNIRNYGDVNNPDLTVVADAGKNSPNIQFVYILFESGVMTASTAAASAIPNTPHPTTKI